MRDHLAGGVGHPFAHHLVGSVVAHGAYGDACRSQARSFACSTPSGKPKRPGAQIPPAIGLG